MNAEREEKVDVRGYVPSFNVEAETALKIIGLRTSEGSAVYAENFKTHPGLGEAGYRHEVVNHY